MFLYFYSTSVKVNRTIVLMCFDLCGLMFHVSNIYSCHRRIDNNISISVTKKFVNESPEECVSTTVTAIATTSTQNSTKSCKNHFNALDEQRIIKTDNNLLCAEKNHLALLQKYAFLFETLCENMVSSVHLFVIHKIEIFPNFTYPLALTQNITAADKAVDDDRPHTLCQLLTFVTSSSSSPYRTCSHYGFNYPLNYLPSIPLYPSTFYATVEMQRQNVIKLISSSITIFEAVQAQKKPHNESTSPAATQTSLEKPESYISMKEIQLRQKGNRRHSTNCKFCSTAVAQRVSQVDGGGEHEVVPYTNSEQLSSILSINDSCPFTHNSSSHLVCGHQPGDVDEISSSGRGGAAGDSAKVWQRSYILKSFSSMDFQKKKKCSFCKGAVVRLTEDFTKNLYLSSNKKNHHAPQLNLTLDDSKASEKDAAGWHQDANLQPKEIKITTPSIEVIDSRTFDSVTSLKSIEIHIAIEMENAEGMKNLQIKAQELKTKLAKIIDDEIALITTQLANKKNYKLLLTQRSYANCTKPKLPVTSSTVEIERRTTIYKKPSQSPQPPKKSVEEYSDTLWLLENELGNLLNNIIRANELHNTALVSECKAKVSQLSQDIRASLVRSRQS